MTPQTIAITRTAVGLLQGLALCLLYELLEAKTWPATDGLVFAPLLMAAIFVPLVVVSGTGNLGPLTLAIWTGVAVLLCGGLALYDIVRAPLVFSGVAPAPRLTPAAPLWFAVAVVLFIAHTLIVSGEADRKLLASYPRYFDVAWKHGVQLLLATFFVLLFWGVLWLGAELLRLITVEFLATLIKQRWFWIPATALVFTGAIHAADMRSGFVRGTRRGALTLLSWLLPLMTLIAVIFMLALPLTGLDALWSTQRASAILMISAAVLIFLINDAYQDGRPDGPQAVVVRYASVVGTVVLLPLVALAAYALMLRVRQYGWTPERIFGLACIAVAGCYAVGYGLALALSGVSLKGIEATNVYSALAIVAVVLVLFTPIADPARISVADQVRRLEAGTVSLAQFDFNFLRFESGRYGVAALERLATRTSTPVAVAIADRANQTLQLQNRSGVRRTVSSTPTGRAAGITVIHPAGQSLPTGFVRQDWQAFPRQWMLPRCLVADEAKCEAILTDIDGDGEPEILLFALPNGSSAALKLAADGTWTFLGTIANAQCAGVRDALRAGRFETIQPLLKEVQVNGQRLHVNRECLPTG
jgi:hypothetical protein